jgi:flagellin
MRHPHKKWCGQFPWTKAVIKKRNFRMFSVNTNLGAMAALQSLNATQSALKETQNEISTGKKISSGSDNPAVYSISQTMQANVAGLSAVSDSLNFGASVVNTAQSATSNIATVLTQLKTTITQGQQTGMDATTLNNSIKQMLSNIDKFAQSATFNGVNLTASGTSGVGATDYKLSVVNDVAGSTIDVSSTDASSNGVTFTGSDSTGLSLTGLSVTSTGQELAFANDTAPVQNDYLSVTAGSKTYDFILSDGSAANTLPQASDSTHINTLVNFSTTDSTGTIMSKIASAMQSQGFGATVTNTGKLDITGNSVSAVSLSGFTGAGSATVSAISGTTSAIATVDAAIKQLNTNSAYLGAKSATITGMATFTSALSSSLTAGIGALTDADMAAESAKLQSLQTKQSLAIQSLSIANQQPQSIMTLFR